MCIRDRNEIQRVLDSMPREALIAEIERLRPEMERRARRMREVPGVEDALALSEQLRLVRAEAS